MDPNVLNAKLSVLHAVTMMSVPSVNNKTRNQTWMEILASNVPDNSVLHVNLQMNAVHMPTAMIFTLNPMLLVLNAGPVRLLDVTTVSSMTDVNNATTLSKDPTKPERNALIVISRTVTYALKTEYAKNVVKDIF